MDDEEDDLERALEDEERLAALRRQAELDEKAALESERQAKEARRLAGAREVDAAEAEEVVDDDVDDAAAAAAYANDDFEADDEPLEDESPEEVDETYESMCADAEEKLRLADEPLVEEVTTTATAVASPTAAAHVEEVTAINAADAPAVQATEAPVTLVGPAMSVLDALSQARRVLVGGAAAEAEEEES